MSIDAYKIGINIAMASNAGSVLSVLSRNLLGIKVGAKDAENALGGMNNKLGMVLGGAAAVAGGTMILASLKAPLKAAEEWQKAVTNMGLYNMGDEVDAQAQTFAKSMNVIGSSYTDNLNMMTEAIGVFRSAADKDPLESAKMVAPTMAKLRMIDATLGDETSGRYHTQEMAMLRFAEITGGLSSPERMIDILDKGYKAIRSSGGNVDWEGLRQFKTRAGAAGFNLTDDALFGKFEPIIGELKGSTTGTSLMTAYNRAVGNLSLMPRNASDMYLNMGLWDKNQVTMTNRGVRAKAGHNPLVDAKLFSEDPIEWYKEHLKTFYDKNNISAEDRYRDNTLLFGRTGGNMFNVIDRQMATIDKSVKAQAQMKNIDGSANDASKTIYGLKLETVTTFKNLMITLGENLIPMVSAGLRVLNPILASLASLAKSNPIAVKVIMGAMVGIGVGMIALGAILIASVTPFIWIPLAIGAAVAAIVGITLWLRTITMADAVKAIKSGVHNVLETIGHFAPGLVSFVRGLYRTVVPIIGFMVKELESAGKHLYPTAKFIVQFIATVIEGIVLGTLIIADKILKITGMFLNGLADFFHAIHGWIDKHFPGLLADPDSVKPNTAVAPPPAQHQTVIVHHTTVLDGKTIQQSVHKAVGTSNMPRGPSDFNPAQHFTPPGATPSRN